MFANPSRTRFGIFSGRDSAMWPSVFLPTSPYSAASGSSPIPTLSRTIQKILSNSFIPRLLKRFSAELYHTRFPCNAYAAAKIWDSTYRSRNPDAPQGISIGATAGAIAFVIVLVALLVHGRSLSHRRGFYSESQHTAQTVDLQGAKTAHARVEMGAGQLNINGGANHMLDADFTYDGTFDAPRVDYHVDGGVGQLSISQNSHSTHFGRSQNDWILRFGKD